MLIKVSSDSPLTSTPIISPPPADVTSTFEPRLTWTSRMAEMDQAIPLRDMPKRPNGQKAPPEFTASVCLAQEEPASGRPTSPDLPWDRFNQWCHCICIVNFDIELGQAIEKVYPSHVKLTEKEKNNICYLAFPDSNSGCMGDTQFHFRTRICSTRKRSLSIHREYNLNCLTPLKVDPSYFYGFVYFRQIKDRSARRGYFQKSLVLISRLPFVTLYNNVVSVLATHFFENGEASLEAGCHDIDQWPRPIPGRTNDLPLVGLVIQVHVPHRNETLNPSPIASPQTSHPPRSLTMITFPLSSPTIPQAPSLIIPSVQELNLFRSFFPVITHIQTIWELVLTCEPLIVMASTPDVCSELVQCLVASVWPLKFSSDYRPFFTIHDSEFEEYTKKTQAPPPVILGVTNPFFAKTLQHWPHIIRIGEYKSMSPQKSLRGMLKSLDWKPGLHSKTKPFLQKDRGILKKLLKGIECRRPAEVQSALIRRYFLELTQSFIIPLERYLASLMPLKKNISAFREPPFIQPFNPDDFYKTLEAVGPQLTSGIKGDWIGLYRKFFRSPNFAAWYEARDKEMMIKLKALHVTALAEANLIDWAENKAEVEIVDLVLRMKDTLRTLEKEAIPVGDGVIVKLRGQVTAVISTLEPDLHDIFNKK